MHGANPTDLDLPWDNYEEMSIKLDGRQKAMASLKGIKIFANKMEVFKKSRTTHV